MVRDFAYRITQTVHMHILDYPKVLSEYNGFQTRMEHTFYFLVIPLIYDGRIHIFSAANCILALRRAVRHFYRARSRHSPE